MAVTMKQVKAVLDPEEPNYEKAAQLGPEALPHLKKIVEKGESHLAPKAAYLAGRIGDSAAVPVLEKAAESDQAEVRMAAASGAAHVAPEETDGLLQTLLDDGDVGVRKYALKSVPNNPSGDLADKVKEVQSADDEPALREIAGDVADRME